MNQLQTAPQTAKVTRSFGYTAIVLLQRRVEHLRNQRRFAAAADTRHHSHHIQREANIDVLEVILCRTDNLYIVIPCTPIRRNRVGEFLYLWCPCIYQFAAMATCFWTNLYRIIRCFLYLIIVLHDDDRIAQIAQLLQYMYQPLCIPWVQTNTGFVQYVQRTYQTTAQRLSQIDTLSLATRQGTGHTTQGQITQTHILHKLKP